MTPDPANPAKQVPTVGLTPAQKRAKEEERAAAERAKVDGPVEGETITTPDGETLTTAEAIERANQEDGGFIAKKDDRRDGTGHPEEAEEVTPAPEDVVDPPQPAKEVKMEDLPDTPERLKSLVAELVKFRSDNQQLKAKLQIAVEKVSRATRERDEANAEVDAYFKAFGPLA